MQGMLLLFGILVCALLYKAIATPVPDPVGQQAQGQHAQAKLRLQHETLRRNDALKFYGALSLIGAINLALLILATGVARARNKKASVHSMQIGQHRRIPVHYKDLHLNQGTSAKTVCGLVSAAPGMRRKLLILSVIH